MLFETTPNYCYIQYYPDKALKDYVKFFYYFRSDDMAPERILPFGTTEITIRVDTGNDDIYITNPATQSYHVKPKALTETVGICFHPWALNSLFKIPQSSISNSKLPLRDVLSDQYNDLTRRLKGRTDHSDIIDLVQSYLVNISDKKHNPLIIDAVRFIDQNHGAIDVNALYKRYNISERRLQQIFNDAIGMSPKKYCLLKRFHKAVAHLNPSANLTNLALNLGYYDQAHFINEFKSFAGICPGGLLKEKNTLNNININTYFMA